MHDKNYTNFKDNEQKLPLLQVKAVWCDDKGSKNTIMRAPNSASYSFKDIITHYIELYNHKHCTYPAKRLKQIRTFQKRFPRRCSAKKLLWKISQHLKENT